MVLSRIWNFEIISLLGKEVRESVFLYSIWWEKAILDDKNVDLLMVKKSKFSKGASPWFLSKIEKFEIVPFRTF